MEELGAEDPRWIGEYRLIRRLGAGGMGRVFLAHSPRGRTVAVKLVQADLAQQAEFRRRFKQEVRAAQRVGGEWTAPVLDADTEAATPWVATGYIAGPSLHAVIAESGRLPERSVRVLARGLALALQSIHGADLIHRDLKPSNVLITIDGPRVIDFGIARALETVADGILTRSGAVVGSPGFMSPEQVRGERVSYASDIFCLGSVLGFASTGRQPFGTTDSGVHAVMYRIAQEEPHLEGVPEGLRDLVTACLSKDPAGRPTLDELLERTADGADEEAGEPWLPASLIAQLGRHAVELLEVETPAGPLRPTIPAPPVVPPAPASPVGGAVPLPPVLPPLASGPATPPAPLAPPAPTSFPLAPAAPPAVSPAAPSTPPPTGEPKNGPPAEPVAAGPLEPRPDPASEPAAGPAAGPTPGTTPPLATPASVSGSGPVAAGSEPPPEALAAGPRAFGPPQVTSFEAAAPLTPGGPGPTSGAPGGPGAIGGPPLPPPPEPERRPRKRLLIISAAVAAVIVAGAATFAVMSSRDDSENAAKSSGEPTAAASATPGDSAAKESSDPPAPSASATQLGGTGDVPTDYLGAWEGEIKQDDEPTGTIRRIVVHQGTTGSDVAETLTAADDSFCQSEAKLKSVEGLLVIESKEPTTAIPQDGCGTFGEQTLRLRNDGSLLWSTTPDGSSEAILRPAKTGSEPVPAGYVGTWLAKDAFGETEATIKITISQGAIGTEVAEDVADGKNYHCEGTRLLASVQDGVVLSPVQVTDASTEELCTPGISLALTAAGEDKLRVQYTDPDSYSDETQTQTFTRLD